MRLLALLLLGACGAPEPDAASLPDETAPQDQAPDAPPDEPSDPDVPPVDPEPEPPPEPLPPIQADRSWQVLTPSDDPRDVVRQAGEQLGDWTIDLAGVAIDGPWLLELAETPEDEPFLRALREKSGRAVDQEDFLWFLDDVLRAGQEGRRGEPFSVPSGRARAAGILLHPDDVFRARPRRYGATATLAVDRPPPQATFPPAQDGDPLGPEWTMRYLNPANRAEHYAALAEERPRSGFASRVASLLAQFEEHGAQTYLASSVRRRERGYLMWGAFILSRAKSQAEVNQLVARLEERNRSWGLHIPITWRHPDGWQATVEAARRMADAYDVVYATENGARYSNHYGGKAVDFVAIDLPREITLRAPDGAVETFDLSNPEEPRDLSLTPRLIDWVEAHFGMRKLESDYPHWSDARGP